VEDVNLAWPEPRKGVRNTELPLSGDKNICLATGVSVDTGQRVPYTDWLPAGKSTSRSVENSLSAWPRLALGPTHPRIQWVPGVKLRVGAQAKKTGIYTSTNQYLFMPRA
jgi:hypothetical protein